MTALWCHGEALCHGDPANGGVEPYGNTHSFDGAQDDIPREPQEDPLSREKDVIIITMVYSELYA